MGIGKISREKEERKHGEEKYRWCVYAAHIEERRCDAIENCSFSEIRTAAGKSFADLE